MSKEEINLDLLQEYQKAQGKIKQTIWIPVEYFIQTLQLSKKFGIANNILLSTIIMAYYKNTNLITKETVIEKPVEKIVEKIKTTWPCYYCWADFADQSELRKHLEAVHASNLQALIKK